MELYHIGQRIRQVRTDAGLSQYEFAAQLAMTQTSLSMIETQKTLPSCFFLYRLHTTFRVSIDWVLSGHGEKKAGSSSEQE